MVRLEGFPTYFEQLRIGARLRQQAEQARFNDLAEVVLACVHPGNLGALPPSPGMIRYRAAQLGL